MFGRLRRKFKSPFAQLTWDALEGAPREAEILGFKSNKQLNRILVIADDMYGDLTGELLGPILGIVAGVGFDRLGKETLSAEEFKLRLKEALQNVAASGNAVHRNQYGLPAMILTEKKTLDAVEEAADSFAPPAKKDTVH